MIGRFVILIKEIVNFIYLVDDIFLMLMDVIILNLLF